MLAGSTPLNGSAAPAQPPPVQAQPQAKPQAQPEAKAQPQPQAKAEAKPQPKAQAEAKAEEKPQAQPQAEPEAKPQPQAKPQAEPVEAASGGNDTEDSGEEEEEAPVDGQAIGRGLGALLTGRFAPDGEGVLFEWPHSSIRQALFSWGSWAFSSLRFEPWKRQNPKGAQHN